MLNKIVIIITCCLALLVVVYYWIYKKYYSSSGYGDIKQDNKKKWWETPVNNTNSYINNFNKILNDKKSSLLKLSGNGPTDSLVQNASINQITDDDLNNYITEYEKIRDQSVVEQIDPQDKYDQSAEFNDPNNADPVASSDNVQYNLYANPDENNYEVITSKQLYEQSEYPIIYDKYYQNKDVNLYIDDNQSILPVTRDSINSTNNIDPAYTDGNIYYPSNDDINTNNLYNLIQSSIDDRIANTQSVYLDNNVLDDSVFTVP